MAIAYERGQRRQRPQRRAGYGSRCVVMTQQQSGKQHRLDEEQQRQLPEHERHDERQERERVIGAAMVVIPPHVEEQRELGEHERGQRMRSGSEPPAGFCERPRGARGGGQQNMCVAAPEALVEQQREDDDCADDPECQDEHCGCVATAEWDGNQPVEDAMSGGEVLIDRLDEQCDAEPESPRLGEVDEVVQPEASTVDQRELESSNCERCKADQAAVTSRGRQHGAGDLASLLQCRTITVGCCGCSSQDAARCNESAAPR